MAPCFFDSLILGPYLQDPRLRTGRETNAHAGVRSTGSEIERHEEMVVLRATTSLLQRMINTLHVKQCLKSG